MAIGKKEKKELRVVQFFDESLAIRSGTAMVVEGRGKGKGRKKKKRQKSGKNGGGQCGSKELGL